MPFRDVPIRRKLIWVIMLTTVSTLILACAGFVLNDQIAFKRNMVQNLTSLSRIIAASNTAALVFEDRISAAESLLSLSEKSHIVAAAILTKDGEVFAEFNRDGSHSSIRTTAPAGPGHEFTDQFLQLRQPVVLDNERIGWVFIQSDLEELHARTRWYAGIALFILLAATGVAMLLSSRLQQFISTPLLNLAHTVRTISRDKNYNIRGEKYGQDEIGDLIDGFNEMLTQIQIRDAKLAQHRSLLEEQVEERTRELKSANEELVAQIHERERAERALLRAQKMDAVGTLAGGIAHDFNNLLQAVQGYTDLLLLNKDRTTQGYRELKEILRATQRASELTQQLLTFSRSVESKLRPLNLNREVLESEKLLERTIPKMIDIRLFLAKDLHHISADPAQIGQVLVNLALNARDAMPEGGTLTLETRNVELDEQMSGQLVGAKPGQYVRLSVRDTGHGMDRETLEHLFEPFFSTKEPGKGTGLGLAMVYGIMENHRGHISCRSQLGKGTTFDLYFPMLQASQVQEETEKEPEISSGGTETILIVDDEEFIRDLGEEILNGFGYKVLTASSGEQGLEIYREKLNSIDLVMLDVIMPGMGGKKCLEELLKINPDVKIVISSGYFVDGATRITLERGAKSFIRKPYNVNQLLQVVRKTLDGKEAGATAASQTSSAQ